MLVFLKKKLKGRVRRPMNNAKNNSEKCTLHCMWRTTRSPSSNVSTLVLKFHYVLLCLRLQCPSTRNTVMELLLHDRIADQIIQAKSIKKSYQLVDQKTEGWVML